MSAVPFALSIPQPSAWAVVAGVIPWEVRVWSPPFEVLGSLVGIYAQPPLDRPPPQRVNDALAAAGLTVAELPCEAVIGVARIVSILDHERQRVGWMLENPRALPRPIVCIDGIVKVWQLRSAVAENILDQLVELQTGPGPSKPPGAR